LVYMYQIYLGGVGSKIAYEYVLSAIRPTKEMLTTLLGKEYDRFPRAVPGIEVQIFDLTTEDKINELIRNRIIRENDEFINIEPDRSLFEERGLGILRYASARIRKYTPIIKYWNYKIENIRGGLGLGRGVQRYRPLARLLTVNAARQISEAFKRDIQNDIVNEPPLSEAFRFITTIVLNIGGGFGSGSFIDILNLFRQHLKRLSRNIHDRTEYMLILNLPTGLQWEFPPEDAPLGKDHLLAAAGAALLDLMYLYEKGNKGYKDNLVDEIARTTDLPETEPYTLTNTRIILTTYNNLEGGDVEEVYRLHDRYVSRILSAVSAAILSVKETAIPLVADNVARIISEVEASFSEIMKRKTYRDPDTGEEKPYPSALALTSTLIATKSVDIISLPKVELKGLREVESLRDDINRYKHRREEIKNRIEQNKERRKELEELLKIVETALDGKIKVTIKGYENFDADIESLTNKLENIYSSLEIINKHAKEALNSYEDSRKITKDRLRDITRQLKEIYLPNIEGILTNVENIIETSINNIMKHEIEKMRNMIIGEVERLSTLFNGLNKLGTILSNIYNITSQINEILEKLQSNSHDDCEKHIFKKGRSDCWISDYLQKTLMPQMSYLIKGIERRRNDVQINYINRIRNALNSLRISIMNRINNIDNEIKDYEKELEKIEEELKEKETMYSKAFDTLKKSIHKYLSRVLHGLIINNIISPAERDEIIEYIIENHKYREKVILESIVLTIKDLLDIIDELYEKGRMKLDRKTLLERIRNYLRIRNTDYLVSRVDLDAYREVFNVPADVKLGVKERILFYTKDNRELIKELGIVTGEEKQIEIDANGSVIMLVEYWYGVPLLAIKDVREALEKFFEKEKVLIIDPETKEEKIVEEYRGQCYLVLEYDKEYEELLKGIKHALDEFNTYLEQTTIR